MGKLRPIKVISQGHSASSWHGYLPGAGKVFARRWRAREGASGSAIAEEGFVLGEGLQPSCLLVVKGGTPHFHLAVFERGLGVGCGMGITHLSALLGQMAGATSHQCHPAAVPMASVTGLGGRLWLGLELSGL